MSALGGCAAADTTGAWDIRWGQAERYGELSAGFAGFWLGCPGTPRNLLSRIKKAPCSVASTQLLSIRAKPWRRQSLTHSRAGAMAPWRCDGQVIPAQEREGPEKGVSVVSGCLSSFTEGGTKQQEKLR